MAKCICGNISQEHLIMQVHSTGLPSPVFHLFMFKEKLSVLNKCVSFSEDCG